MSAFYEIVRSDLYRYYKQKKLKYLLKGILVNRNYRVIFLHRVCYHLNQSNSLFSRLLLLPFRLFHKAAAACAGVDLSWQTKIQEGFCINHGWGIVINPRTVIGKNVTIFHGVTLGQRDKIHEDGTRESFYPVIENGVWIGPHAIIVGGVKIGEGCIIGGGAFVTDSVPARSVVIGNPSRIVKSDCLPDIVNPV